MHHSFPNRRRGALESQGACWQRRFVARLEPGTQAEHEREAKAFPLEREWGLGALSHAVHCRVGGSCRLGGEGTPRAEDVMRW